MTPLLPPSLLCFLQPALKKKLLKPVSAWAPRGIFKNLLTRRNYSKLSQTALKNYSLFKHICFWSVDKNRIFFYSFMHFGCFIAVAQYYSKVYFFCCRYP